MLVLRGGDADNAEGGALTELAEEIAGWVANVQLDAIPEAAIHEAKRRVVDSIGVAFGAYNCPPGKAARVLCRRTQASPGATTIGMTHATAPDLATFHNGVLFRYLDFNDTYLALEPAHPSDNIAAALAAAELAGSTGRQLLGAIVLGYEIQCRLCDAASLRSHGWDHTTYGTMSAALLAGKLLGLNAEQLRHALALAVTPNVALRQTRSGELSMWKGCAFAAAARGGVFAALLASEGVTGPWQIFEGEFGIWKQLTGRFALPPFAGHTGDDWMIHQTHIKFWPVEYHAQSAVDAALQLRSVVQADQVDRIEIISFDAAVDIIGKDPEKFAPKSRETADHSMPYCVAAALLAGDITTHQFDDEWLQDERVRGLLARTTVHRDATLTAGYPEGIPNLIRVTLKDGSRHEREVRFPRGHARNPMTDAEVRLKFDKIVAESPLAPTAARAYEELWQIDSAVEVTGLVRRLAVEPTSGGSNA